MGAVTKSGPTEVSTMAIGRMTRRTVVDDSSMPTATFMMAIGRMIRRMASDSTRTQMELNTKDTGRMTSNTEKVKSNGLMARNMKVNTNMERRMALDNLVGLTIQATAAISSKIISMDKAHTLGQMVASSMEPGTTTKCMVKESLPGPTVENMRVNTYAIKRRAGASSTGPTIANTKVNGITGSRRASASTSTPRTR